MPADTHRYPTFFQFQPARLQSAFTQLLSAVKTLWGMGLLHRDLKLGNVLFCPNMGPDGFMLKVGPNARPSTSRGLRERVCG